MNIKKIMAMALSMTMAAGILGSCGGSDDDSGSGKSGGSGSASADGKIMKQISDIDTASLKGKTITLYTHGGNRVLGEEKKDADGNTYRDESYAYLKHLAEKFEQEYEIHVDLQVNSTEDDIKPLLQTQDPSIDIYTSPNFSIEEWQQYAEPYATVEEAKEYYGDYATTMYNDGTYIYALMPAKTYNNAVVYNEETIKKVGYDSIPTTQAEFEEMCTKLREAGIDPIAMHRIENWPLSTINDFANYVAGTNDAYPAMLKSDTPFSESEPMGKTIKMYTDWKSRGFFEADIYTDFGVAMDSVGNGNAAMMLFGAWVVPQIQGRVPEGGDPASIKFAPAPDFGNGQYVMASAADSYAIAKGSDDKEAARLFIEYISESAQYLADSGYIANKKGVDPVVPDLYKIIDDAVAAGTCKVLYAYATDDNSMHNEEVLSEAALLEDVKYVGNLFDSIDVTKDPDWSAYDAQVEKQNAAYKEARDFLGYSWK
ncbi:MAG: extracellular solute-binding protein [Ruminococcus sp.]|nr:extracellular solute-binding protein [Ruminococcus sp.]MBR1864707.1 extracellular solute-binding protein [Ruminococcus sp.]